MRKLKKLLKAYGAGLDFFNENDPEADLLYIYRAELEENKHLLSPKELNLLYRYDLEAVKLYDRYKNYDTEAVDWLKDTVQIAKENLKKQ